jgi:hypothetical protein
VSNASYSKGGDGDGSGIFAEGGVYAYNNVITGNTGPGECQQVANSKKGGNFHFKYNAIENLACIDWSAASGTVINENNIDLDGSEDLFSDNYTPAEGGLLENGGDKTLYPDYVPNSSELMDLKGDVRMQGGQIDIGAYECNKDPVDPQIVLDGAIIPWDGEPHPLEPTTTPPNLPVTITYNGDETAPSDIGTYAVIATVDCTVDDIYYYDTAEAQLEIRTPYTITATAGDGGTITPSGEVIVAEGLDQTFEFSPNKGYRIRSVTVDGEPQPVSGNSYTFENVTADHAIEVEFRRASSRPADSGPAPSSPTPSQPSGAPPAPSSTETDGTVTSSLNTGANLTSAEADALLNSAKEAEAQNKKAVLEIKPELSDSAQSVQVTLPRNQFDAIAGETSADLRISTDFVELTFDNRALDSISGSGAFGDNQISVQQVSRDTLPAAVRSKVGNRPVYDFSVTVDGTQISDFGSGNVVVGIPYTPAPGEDLNAIVIYYINDQGELETVTNGRYDAATGKVIFSTSHFSRYAVGYNKVQFKDVPSGAWYYDAVSFIAARGITEGVGNGNFAPNMTLTRGQFITCSCVLTALPQSQIRWIIFLMRGIPTTQDTLLQRSDWASLPAWEIIVLSPARLLPDRKCSSCCTAPSKS